MSCKIGGESVQPIGKIAGYDVYGIFVFSVCDIENGKINTNYLDSLVFESYYTFGEYDNPDAVVNDLREKLSFLYGKERIKDDRLFSYYWQGQNETEVKLTKAGVLIDLTYTDKSIANHFEKINSIVYEGTANLDGL